MGVHPTSTATPTIPRASPPTFLAESASPAHTAATTALNSGVVELRMAASEAVRATSDAAMSVKGAAALTHPSTKNSLQRGRSAGRRPTATA